MAAAAIAAAGSQWYVFSLSFFYTNVYLKVDSDYASTNGDSRGGKRSRWIGTRYTTRMCLEPASPKHHTGCHVTTNDNE